MFLQSIFPCMRDCDHLSQSAKTLWWSVLGILYSSEFAALLKPCRENLLAANLSFRTENSFAKALPLKISWQPICPSEQRTAGRQMGGGLDRRAGGAKFGLVLQQGIELLPSFCGHWHCHGGRGCSGYQLFDADFPFPGQLW